MLTHRSTFFSIFPPPDLLTMPSASLHIADDTLRAILLKKKGKSYQVKDFFELALPKGLVDGGIITNENALAQEIKKVKEKMGLSLIRVALPETRMYLFTLDLGGVKRERVREMIETKLEENVPIPPAEVIFEYIPYETKGNIVYKVSVSAFSEKLIQSYFSCCTLAGLSVLGFDTEPNCLIRALDQKEDKTVLCVDISENNTSMYVVSGKNALFSSTITVGGLAITESIAKMLSKSIQEANEVKIKELLTDGERTKELFGATLNTLSIITDEITKVISYWNSHAEKDTIKQVYVVGRDAGIVGLTEYFESMLKVPVSVGNVWSGALPKDSIPPITYNDALDYGIAIGLSIYE